MNFLTFPLLEGLAPNKTTEAQCGEYMNKVWLGVGAAAAVSAVVGIFWLSTNGGETPDAAVPQVGSTAIVTVKVPETLSANAEIGKTVYEAKCAACHAAAGEGQVDTAPPLIHVIYEPSHHGGEAFQRAAANGVRAHHWKFGDMPPVNGLTRGDMAMVIDYIREVQRANGIN